MATKKKKVTKKAAPRAPKSSAATGKYMSALHAKFGKLSAAILDLDADAAEHVSTGLDVLDHYVLRGGGSPVGRMTELFGPENSGKTSFGYNWIAATQRAGGLGVWLSSPGEGGIDTARAASVFGVDLSKLLIVYPQHLEECFEQMKFLLTMHNPESGPLMIVWDSIAAMVSEGGLEREAGNRRVGDVPLIMSEELKKVIPLLEKHRAHLLAINQIRAKIGVMFGDNTTTPGGNAPKFYASQRIQLFGGKAVKNARKEHVGKILTMIVVKNRFGPPWVKARVRLDYATGFNNIWSTVWHAKQMKLIKCRAEGFAGPSHEGLAAYNESLEKLGWTSRVPLPDEADEEVELDVEISDGDDEDEEAVDADGDDQDD